jgi:ABC-2 type transport system ATP-binding protein
MLKDKVLQIENVEKLTPKKLVMADINIHLNKGEIFALVGEPQSGKTLLSKIIITLVHKTKGVIKVADRNFVGTFLQQESFMPKDRPIDVIQDYCKINDRPFNIKRVKNILTLLKLKQKAYTPIYKLTESETDRLKIAMPIIVQSDILILDYPFADLTKEESHELRVILKTLADKMQVAVLITARTMAEIEEFCDTIGIIDDGMIVEIKTYNEMLQRDADHTKIAVKVIHPNYAAKIIETELEFRTQLCGDCVIVTAVPDNAQKIVDALTDKHLSVLAVTKVHRSLQNQYYEIIQKRRNYY